MTNLLSSIAGLSPTYLLTVVVILLTFYLWPVWSSYYYPHGPIPIPLIGHLYVYFLNKEPHRYLTEKFGSKYKDLFTVWKGMAPAVYLHSQKAIYEGFVEKADSLNEHPKHTIFEFNGVEGLIGGKAGHWQLLRKQHMAVLREHGVGKAGMEDEIIEESGYYLDELDKKVGQPFDPANQLLLTTSNVITRVLFGDRIGYGSEKLKNLQFDDYLFAKVITEKLPFLRYLPGDPLRIDYLEKERRFKAGEALAREQIQSHSESLDMDHPRDFIDSFMIEIERTKNDPDTPFTRESLLTSLMGVYVAGSGTTAAALRWVFLTLLTHPTAQEKVRMEVDDVIETRRPKYNDQKSMPYTQAVITEALRRSIAAESIAHVATRDVVICGQNIPKGTEVSALYWATNHNELQYPDPIELKPERFLDSEGHYVKPGKGYIPFSVGPRACIGETLSKTEIFLFLVSTLQRFSMSKVAGQKYALEADTSVTHSPQPFKLVLTRRNG